MIRYNHIGYQTFAPKTFVIDNPEEENFQIYHIDSSVQWKEVYSGKLEKTGDVFKGDFSAVQAPGDYQIRCGSEKTNDFVIKNNPYSHIERMLTIFFTWQRCGSKKGWAGVCHQEPDNLYGTDKKLDMRGGYHQSGDLRCWHDGTAAAIYGYMRYAEESDPEWEDGIFDEEIRWGVDYFRKTVSPEGFVYDCQFVPLGWGSRDYYNVPAPLPDQYIVCRLLARSSVYFKESDPKYAAENLTLAEKIWNFVENSNAFDKPYVPIVEDLPPGTQGARFYWQSRKNCTGTYSAASTAAYDLYLATGNRAYWERTENDTAKVIACQITSGEASGIFRDTLENTDKAFQDCGYGHLHGAMVFIADLIKEQGSSPRAGEWKDALERYCDMLVREYKFIGFHGMVPSPLGIGFDRKLADAPPFTDSPIPLVHKQNYSNTLSAKLSYILASAYEIFGKAEYQIYAQRALDFLLGFNPFAASQITGAGFNHSRIPTYGQFFPSTPHIPGGVLFINAGEYDLPAAGILMRTLTKFRD